MALSELLPDQIDRFSGKAIRLIYNQGPGIYEQHDGLPEGHSGKETVVLDAVAGESLTIPAGYTAYITQAEFAYHHNVVGNKQLTLTDTGTGNVVSSSKTTAVSNNDTDGDGSAVIAQATTSLVSAFAGLITGAYAKVTYYLKLTT